MLKNPPRVQGTFFAHSLDCDCDPDRIIEDHQGKLHCGDCMVPLEKVHSRDLPGWDQDEILVKLKAQARGKSALEEQFGIGSDDEDEA